MHFVDYVSSTYTRLVTSNNRILVKGMIPYFSQRREFFVNFKSTPYFDLLYDCGNSPLIRDGINELAYRTWATSRQEIWFINKYVRSLQISESLFGDTSGTQGSLPQSVGREPQCSSKAGDGNGSDSGQPFWWQRIKSFPSGDYKAIASGAIINLGALIVALVWSYVIGKARREDQ
jgi:hypothetical protein